MSRHPEVESFVSARIELVRAKGAELLHSVRSLSRTLRHYSSPEVILLTGSTLLLMAILNLADRGSYIVYAAENTPTPITTPIRTATPRPVGTPTPTSIPDAQATRIADKRATVTALEKKSNQDTVEKELDARIASLRGNNTTPTATVVPPDVMIIPRKDFNAIVDKAIDVGVKAGVKEALAEQAKSGAPATPSKPPPGGTPPGGRDQGGGPWGLIIAGLISAGVTVGAGITAFARSERLRNWLNNTFGGGGAAPAAPAAGGPAAP